MFLALLLLMRVSAGSCWIAERSTDVPEILIQNGSRWLSDRLIDFTMIPHE
jgi:hypothetical protein